MNMSNEIIKSYCHDCCQNTNHKILSEHTKDQQDDYQCAISHQILQCLGCDTRSFREVFYDIESAHPSYDTDDWIIPEDITIYPKAIEGHKKIGDLWELPDIVRIIYSETLTTYREGTKVLAGLGLRATIEAVCNDLKITGKNLEAKINKLVSSGYISKIDAERLHGIRFMGNDAAHDIKKPNDIALSIALKIIEHLIVSVYILEKKASDNIDTAISKYENFEKLLQNALKNFNISDEYPIAQYLGNDMRRVQASISTLEQELITKINNGDYTKLSVGKIDTYKNSPDKLQHFIVT